MNTTLITQHNIFNPHDRMVLPTYATHSSQVLEELLIADGFEVELYKNSELQLDPFDIKQGDIINVVFIPMGGGGGGKQILSLVAMIGLAILAPQAAAWMTGYTGTATMGAMFSAGAFGTFALSVGLMVGGSLLINSVLSPSTPSLSLNDNLSTSTTYSWDESYNKFQQGLSVPKVFGTHKITPPLISKFVETIDNKQYFNGLYAVNDGKILSISDIKINDESIDNFSDVTTYIRNGTLNQSMIPNFDNVRSDKGVSKKLSTTYSNTETNGNGVVGLTATLLFTRGLYYAQNDGNIGANSVKVVLEYSSDNIIWKDLATDDTIPQYYYGYDYDNGYFRADGLNGNFIEWVSSLPTGAIRYQDGSKYYRYNEWYYTTAYTVPYATITDSSTSTLRKTFKVSNLTPSKYYIRAKFYENPPSGTRYGSDCYLEYITEEIGDDFIYPSTALIAIRALATDQLSGNAPKISCVVSANSSNPSLIVQQMLSESGIDSVRILSSFNEWETHCNTKGYAFNGVFDTSVTLRKALDLIGTAGRGTVLQFGSKFDVIMDRAEEIPVQSFTFGMGNILKDSFSQSFLPILDRANVIEATYYDANNNYEPTIIEVSNNNYDSVAEENRTSITLVGFTSRTQAIKHCNYLLNCNRYLTETVSLEADKDSLVCKYGSIVSVSHDVPQYGFSGRIEACTTTKVTLDRDVTLESGKSYYIQLRDNENNTDYHYVNNSVSTTDTLTFTTALTTAYDKYDNYAFGEVGKANKLFRVLRINTAQDMTRKLELLEYNEDVYNDDGDIVVPQISALGLSNLRATDYIRYAKDGSIETVMQLAWSGASISYNVAYRKTTDSAYTSIKAYDNKIDLIVDDVAYEIIVTDTQGMSASLLYSVQGKTIPPEDVTNLVCTESGNIFTLTWDYIPPVDFKEFVIYLASVEVGRTSSKTFSYKSLGLVTKTFTVKAIDTTNNFSIGVSVNKIALSPNIVNGLSASFGLSGITLSWSKSTDDDFGFYEVREADSGWGTIGTLYKGVDTSCIIAPTTNKTYYIKQCDLGGNYSTLSSIAVTLPKPSTPSNIAHSFSDTTSSMAEVTLNWDDSNSPFGISYYKVVYGAKNITIKASELKVTADWDGDRVFSITAYDSFDFASTTAQKTITKAFPNAPTNFKFQVIDNNVLFNWDEPVITTLPITSYELRRGVTWATAEMIGKKSGGFTTVFESVGGNFTYWIASIDSDNRYSTPTSVTATVSQPPDFVLNVSNTSNFTGGTLCALSTTDKSSNANVSGNTLTSTVVANSWDTNVRSTIGTLTGKWYWEVTIGNGGTYPNAMFIGVGTSSTTLANYVGSDSTSWGYYGIDGGYFHSTINKPFGEKYTTGDVIGVALDATLGLLIFFKNGIKQGTSISIGTGVTMYPMISLYKDEIVTANFGELPFKYSPPSGFNGFSNLLLENGYLLANIDTAKTWATHFSSQGWTTIQAQIGAGYPIFIQPTLISGYYEETVDLGTTLASSRITVTVSGETLAGVVTTSCDISISTDGTNWTTYTNMFQVFATNFRYYKFKINVSATTATGLYKIINITSVLDSKLKNDGGSKACLSTDVGGTVVNFNMPFVDITSITVTPLGTTPITAMYDFVDMPNPTSFKILLFNSSGTRVSGTASWSVKGY